MALRFYLHFLRAKASLQLLCQRLNSTWKHGSLVLDMLDLHEDFVENYVFPIIRACALNKFRCLCKVNNVLTLPFIYTHKHTHLHTLPLYNYEHAPIGHRLRSFSV